MHTHTGASLNTEITSLCTWKYTMKRTVVSWWQQLMSYTCSCRSSQVKKKTNCFILACLLHPASLYSFLEILLITVGSFYNTKNTEVVAKKKAEGATVHFNTGLLCHDELRHWRASADTFHWFSPNDEHTLAGKFKSIPWQYLSALNINFYRPQQ